MNYEESLAWLGQVPKFRENNEPGSAKQLLERLGNPQHAFQIIHVAGTNGKGSVCAFLEIMLRQAGYRTGLFTSPHLLRVNERYRICGEDADDLSFASACGQVRRAAEKMEKEGIDGPTWFEVLFAAGLLIFREAKIDVLVMETGMGGRLDATNAVEAPKVCVITSVSLDHTQYLGGTVQKIAGEKAGIIKPAVPVVYDASDPDVSLVITHAAMQAGSRAIPFVPGMAEIVRREEDGIDFILNNTRFDHLAVHVPFAAEYQVANASLALMALRVFDPLKRITDAQAAEALAKAKWPGRMQQVMPGVILDGAHNPDGIRQFVKTVCEMQKSRPVCLLFSAVKEKDHEAMIRTLTAQTQFTSVVVTGVGGSRREDPRRLAALFRRFTDAPVESVDDPAGAFERALALRPADGILFCAGSLYLAAEILRMTQMRQRSRIQTAEIYC